MLDIDTRVLSWVDEQRKRYTCPYCGKTDDFAQTDLLLLVHLLHMHPLRFGVQRECLMGNPVPDFCREPEYFAEEDAQARTQFREYVDALKNRRAAVQQQQPASVKVQFRCVQCNNEITAFCKRGVKCTFGQSCSFRHPPCPQGNDCSDSCCVFDHQNRPRTCLKCYRQLQKSGKLTLR